MYNYNSDELQDINKDKPVSLSQEVRETFKGFSNVPNERELLRNGCFIMETEEHLKDLNELHEESTAYKKVLDFA